MSSPIVYIRDSNTQKLIPLSQHQTINIYFCGPTMYADLHIGNFRNIVLFNALYNFLKSLNYKVKLVQNITDIDDKIVAKSKKLGISEKETVTFFLNNYKQLLKEFQISSFKMLLVTENIHKLIDFIQEMETKKIVYKTNEGLYFDLNKAKKDYNIFREWTTETERFEKLREIQSTEKINLQDFAVWKYVSSGISWDAPFGKGRPGWHTECSALIWDYFSTQSLAIHGGGMDLMFPHNANERIQFLALTGNELAAIWMHNGFININNEKISKTKEHSFLIKDFIKKYSPNAITLFLLSCPYSNMIDFLESDIEKFENKILKIESSIRSINLKSFILNKEIKKGKTIDKGLASFNNYLSKNFDTKEALNYVFTLVKKLNILTEKKKFDTALNYSETIIYALKILGINLKFTQFDVYDQTLILQWDKLVNNKSFIEADKLRKQLIEKNIF